MTIWRKQFAVSATADRDGYSAKKIFLMKKYVFIKQVMNNGKEKINK